MSKNKSGGQKKSLLATIVGVVVIAAGMLIYAVTGIDFLGITTPDDPAAPVTTPMPDAPGDVQMISVGQGRGAGKGFWEVYFTAPSGNNDRSTWVNGIDVPLANAIDNVQNTLDIAAFELNNEAITEAIINAQNRGVQVRMVVDDEHVLDDDDSTIAEIELAGIPFVDDSRSGLMHNKFLIMDGITVWTGSTNLTMNGVYRNNNNLIRLRSRRAVEAYQAEFDEMFARGEFGVTSSEGNIGQFTQDGVPVEIYFASENNVIEQILEEVNNADSEIRFMTFSFTRDDIGDAILQAAGRNINVQGIFETLGSETQYSEMPRMYCAGLDVRQDGNNGILHHKVFIIDRDTVITGSFNYSNNAVRSNDENMIIIQDADLAALYMDEFNRVWQQGRTVTDEDVVCN